MPTVTDVQYDKLQQQFESKTAFQEEILRSAEAAGRDPNPDEQRMYSEATDALREITARMKLFEERMTLVSDSRERNERITRAVARVARPDTAPEYRSAGAYITDVWQAGAGVRTAAERLDVYHRVADHQTTAESAGLLPQPIVQPILDFIDVARPIVNFLGPRNVAAGPTFFRPQVTAHTSVALQSAEKAELVSQAMTITKLTVTMETYGGYVNLSRQLLDWSSPDAMDIVVNDLAGQYARVTEDVTGDALVTYGTADGTLPTAPDVADIVGVLWTAAAAVYAATANAGRLFVAVSPDVLGKLGPAFAPVNPQNAQSAGFSAGDFSSGVLGTISGIPVVMSPQLPTGTMIVTSTAAVEVYEQRIGALSVTEPSVLGVQVAYAGHFAAKVLVPGGVQKITVTP
jgi:HK97 family phage major capsid protein